MRGDKSSHTEIELDQLTGLLGYQIRQAQTAVFRDISPAMDALGLTPGEFSLLTLVSSNPGVTQVQLAKIYRLDKSTLSVSVKRLKQREFLRSDRSNEDGRYFSLWLTDAGRKLLASATRRIDAQERVMDGVLKPGEREALLDMLRRISHAFNP